MGSARPISSVEVSQIPCTKEFPHARYPNWPSGTSADSEDTLRFSALTGVAPMIETYPLTKAAEAYQRMLSGKARFRVVLVP